MRRRILLGVMLAVFLVSLIGVVAQAEVLMKTKQVQIDIANGYPATITVKYPDFKEIKEFSIEEGFCIYLTLSADFRQAIPNGLVFSIFKFGKAGSYYDYKKNPIFRPTKVIISGNEVKIEGYIKLIPKNLAEILLITEAIDGGHPLSLVIWWEESGVATLNSHPTKCVDLD